MEPSNIQATIKAFILKEFLEGEDPEALTDSTELISSGILDSLATLKLVTFLENTFDVQVHAHEADAEHLNTLALMTELVHSKKK
jgi:acyl carrier protein